jgi:hypothetical protein
VSRRSGTEPRVLITQCLRRSAFAPGRRRATTIRGAAKFAKADEAYRDDGIGVHRRLRSRTSEARCAHRAVVIQLLLAVETSASSS